MTPPLPLLVVGILGGALLHGASCEPKPRWHLPLRIQPLHLPAFEVKVTHFKMENCGSESDPAKLENVTVSSKHGVVTVSGAAVVTKPLESPIKAKLEIKVRLNVVGHTMTVPCKNGVGSCEYEDLCDFGVPENGECPDMIQQLGFPCRCPIEADTYVMEDKSFHMGHFGTLATGHYSLLANLTHNDDQVCCYTINFALVT